MCGPIIASEGARAICPLESLVHWIYRARGANSARHIVYYTSTGVLVHYLTVYGPLSTGSVSGLVLLLSAVRTSRPETILEQLSALSTRSRHSTSDCLLC